MTKRLRLVLGLAAVLLLTAIGSATPAVAADARMAATEPRLSTVLLFGDCIAAAEALPLAAAFGATNVRFQSFASVGGGNVVGPFSEENWKDLPGQIASAKPSVVIYQLTTYDWGTEEEQRAAYRRLADTVAAAGAKLIFVTSPPIVPDDFYRPHMAELERSAHVAKAVAKESRGKAEFLHAVQVWGPTYQRLRDGEPDRGADGIHICPQGAARFAGWLLGKLSDRYPGFTAPDPKTWIDTGWSTDEFHFQGC